MSSSSVDRELSVSLDIIKLQEKLLQNSLAVAVSIESLDSQGGSIFVLNIDIDFISKSCYASIRASIDLLYIVNPLTQRRTIKVKP